ncbi:MAG TPA: hypothetical protein VNC50_19700, partial [Planctomycetia bacterium]|nr:hypothetical protein [Planctomycetia bacterium]
MKAQAALAAVVPNPDPALAPAALLAIARGYDDHQGPRELDFDIGRIWSWKDGKPSLETVGARAAELHYGIKNADAAIAIDPDFVAAREFRVRLLVERGSEADLADADAQNPALVDAALRQAVALHKTPAALGAVRQLAKIGGAASLAGLSQALDYPDARVQFDAARALAANADAKVSPGRIAPILARAADTSRRPLAVIVDRDGQRGAGVASQFSQLGYETRNYQDGRAAFADVADSGAAALVVLDPDLRAPSTRDLVAELRRDLTSYEREQIRLKQDKQTRLEGERNEMYGYAVRVPDREKRVFSLEDRVKYLINRLGYVDDPAAYAKLMTAAPDYVLIPQRASLDRLTLEQMAQRAQRQADDLENIRTRYRGVAVLARIAGAQNLGRALELVFEDSIAKPLTLQERIERQRAALNLLEKLVDDPRHSAALAMSGLHLSELLVDEAAAPQVAKILAAIPAPKHQRDLAGIAAAGPLPAPIRIASADALLSAFDKFGVVIDNPTKVTIVRAAAASPKGPLGDSLSKLVARFGPK